MALLLGSTLDAAARGHIETALRMDTVAGAAHRIVYASGWEETFEWAHRHPVQLLIFDPYESGSLVLTSPARFQRVFPSVALLPYTSFSRSHVRDVLRLANLGIRTVAVRGEDDHPATLRPLIGEALSSAMVRVVLVELQGLVPEELAGSFPLRAW